MCLNKLLNEIEANDLTIKIFFISTLFLTSCAGRRAKDYQYIETSMQTNLMTTAPKEQRPLEISAKSDSDAYIQAYLNFCISKKLYNNEFQKSGAIAGKPLSFRLLNEEGIDITNSVKFLNMESIKKNIEKRVSTFELEKNDEK